MEVRIFKRLVNTANRSIYAVSGAKSQDEAIKAVIRKKKESMSTYDDYFCVPGVIAPYTDESGKKWDGLYINNKIRGKKCLVVSR